MTESVTIHSMLNGLRKSKLEMFTCVAMYVDKGISQIYFVGHTLSNDTGFVIRTDVALLDNRKKGELNYCVLEIGFRDVLLHWAGQNEHQKVKAQNVIIILNGFRYLGFELVDTLTSINNVTKPFSYSLYEDSKGKCVYLFFS